jgi:hypothetical protein
MEMGIWMGTAPPVHLIKIGPSHLNLCEKLIDSLQWWAKSIYSLGSMLSGVHGYTYGTRKVVKTELVVVRVIPCPLCAWTEIDAQDGLE